MKYELPNLNYAQDALAPHISATTLEFHHGKHHLAYVTNLNKLIAGSYLEGSPLETIIKESGGPIFNNAAQVWNHTFYFESLSPKGGGEPGGKLAEAICQEFGSFASFKEKFSTAAVSIFGSGWAWLVKNEDNKLGIVQTSNAENPIRSNLTPLLTCDVWEHAYYLDYQNRRADYVDHFFALVDWAKVEQRFLA
ncbi:MAG: superoxide dismutase [Bacteroidales bacterium]|nr:superoxide dismutase [Bacteroidales bacterium]